MPFFRGRRRVQQRRNRVDANTPNIRSTTSRERGGCEYPLCRLFVYGLQHSFILRAQLPTVRRLALIETIQHLLNPQQQQQQQDHDRTDSAEVQRNNQNRKEKEALSIILYNVHTSPYLSTEEFQSVVLEILQTPPSDSPSFPIRDNTLKNKMADMILDGDWEGLLSISSSRSSEEGEVGGGGGREEENEDNGNSTEIAQLIDTSTAPIAAAVSMSPAPQQDQIDDEDDRDEEAQQDRLRSFRDMVVMILSTSRKIASMDITRRRLLGSKVHSAQSIHEIVQIAFTFLDTSTIFTDQTQRQNIKDVISRGRFDLLLTTEFFDCEESQRRRVQRGGRNGTVTLFSGGDITDGANSFDEEEGKEEIVPDLSIREHEFEDDECVICLGEMHQSNITILRCNHRFCTECIDTWMANSSTCPTCRDPISYQHGFRNQRASTPNEQRNMENTPTLLGINDLVLVGILCITITIFSLKHA